MPILPSSLSPHVCILSSPDLQQLLESSGLPPLPQVLQAFAPLSQVTTRTTALTSVPHSSFAIRFSDLAEIEAATHEDEEQRAGRIMDWIGARIAQRCARWADILEAKGTGGNDSSGKDNVWKDRTPWWEEVKKCVEGDHVPNSIEGWNHPVSIIYAVSTMAVNPLQALQDLHSRGFDFPPWVDITHLRYCLIVHPSSSPLADPIAEALFNAVKKQFGLHTYLLPLELPTSPFPPSVAVPALSPRLPPAPIYDSPPLAPQPTPAALLVPNSPAPVPMSPGPRSPGPPALNADPPHERAASISTAGNTLRLHEADIQQTGRFVREFVVMSLVPWMEKCVIDWNETYSSSRRLPLRLLSSTRRLFGSSTPTPPPPPNHGSNPSISSVSSRFTSHGANSSISSIASISSLSTTIGGVTQQRRLAEFATILGDYRVATAIWENLRKEGRGGSEILPLLLAPSPALALHAAHALSTLHPPTQQTPYESPAHVQLRALVYAVRWEIGIDRRDFLSLALEGERWLVHAAAGAEEPPTALLLAHAAFLSEKKGSRRRSALWYLASANRLEKTGIKPLAMYFFRKALQLYQVPHEKELSPSFWESEDRDPADWPGFEAILPGIEHKLGRLLYTTGDTEGAVRYFLGLLRCSVSHDQMQAGGNVLAEARQTDKVYLDDFRVALQHFKATERSRWEAADLSLPITLCQVKQTRIRFPGDAVEGDSAEWDRREQDWAAFWAPRGKERLEKSGKAAVDETFWVDLVMRNPLDVEVTLSGLSVEIGEASSHGADSARDFLEVEVLDDIVIDPQDTRTIPVSVKCKRPASLVITHVVYDFLSLLPVTESLAIRGRRLHDTPLQRQTKTYAPDVMMKLDVEEAGQRLHVNFADDRHLMLAEGEYKRLELWLTNSGARGISELWMIAGEDDEIWLDIDQANSPASSSISPPLTEVSRSQNSLEPRKPFQIPLQQLHTSSHLAPSASLHIHAILHASHIGEQYLNILFVFREAEGAPFHCARVTRHYEVKPVIRACAFSQPSASLEHAFLIDLEVENTAAFSNVRLTQVSAMSALWECSPLAPNVIGDLAPRQVSRLTLRASPWHEGSGAEETKRFVAHPSGPPPIDLLCRHMTEIENENVRSVSIQPVKHFVHSGKRNHGVHWAKSIHPYIPADTHKYIFPLYNPSSIDVLVFWELPTQERSGHILIPGLIVGAAHAALREIVEEAENAKVKRSMYAETQRERVEILRAIRDSEWNAEMDPVVVTIQDGLEVEHDFSTGPCSVSVKFAFRNSSLTNPCRILLKLPSQSTDRISPFDLLPPQYTGRLMHRRVLSPAELATIPVKLWVTRPGSYVIDGWTLEIEVGERPIVEIDSQVPDGGWKSRQLRYVQSPQPGDRCCITVVDNASTGR
ncbi:ER-golgi trafficking TRAPP I complex 85 kDa subunit-domain-containing protein [Amylocystis lapponica]|nr:ER-golgi trafficking TRAPP I complex 85 kDa subunit-domain-containing protein [Amylocystis lapponica]